MDGDIRVDRSYMSLSAVAIVSGLAISAFFAFISLRGNGISFTLNDLLLSSFFIAYGVFMTCFGCVSMVFSRRAFIHVDETTVTAFCQRGLNLHCGISDISLVVLLNTGLSIRLKSGKKYSIFFIQNAADLYRYIRNRMPAEEEQLTDITTLRRSINILAEDKKRADWYFFIPAALIVPLLLVQGFWIGYKEIRQLSAGDWIVFSAFFVLILSALAVSAVSFTRSNKLEDELHRQGAALDHILLWTEPLPIGRALKVYVDEDRVDPFRFSVFGFPDSSQVYYIAERIVRHSLRRVYDSELFDSIEELNIFPESGLLKEIPLPPERQEN